MPILAPVEDWEGSVVVLHFTFEERLEPAGVVKGEDPELPRIEAVQEVPLDDVATFLNVVVFLLRVKAGGVKDPSDFIHLHFLVAPEFREALLRQDILGNDHHNGKE